MAKKTKMGKPTIDLVINALMDVCYILVKHYVKQNLLKTDVKVKSGVFMSSAFRYFMSSNARIDKLPEECDCITVDVLNISGINTQNLKNFNWRRANHICQEHMTPVSYLTDLCFECIYNNINQPVSVIESRLRNMLDKMFKVCWVTKSEMTKLDNTKCQRRNLKDFMPNPNDPYSRYKFAGISFHKIDIKKTWHSSNPKQQIFI